MKKHQRQKFIETPTVRYIKKREWNKVPIDNWMNKGKCGVYSQWNIL